MAKKKVFNYELPRLEDETIWEKIPISEDGVQDLIVDFSAKEPFFLRKIGISEPERRVGKSKIYRKINLDLVCHAYSFFEDSEPAILCWFQKDRKDFHWAMKIDETWIVVRPPERIMCRHISTKNYGTANPSCDAMIFTIYNDFLKKEIFGKVFIREL